VFTFLILNQPEVRLLGRWFRRLLGLQRQVQEYCWRVGVDPAIPELQWLSPPA